jgi:hypothetical protein
MKMMFNGLDRPFELLNSRYGREAQKIFCFAKHHSITLSLSLYIYMKFLAVLSVKEHFIYIYLLTFVLGY